MASSIVRTLSSRDGAGPWLVGSDIRFVATLPVLVPLAWLTPRRLRPGLSRLIATAAARLQPAAAAAVARTQAAAFGLAEPAEFLIAAQSELHLERLNLFAMHCPLHRLPPTRLVGAEHLRAALAAGRGAILWVVATAHSRTETKLSLFREGLRIHHLSRDFHGFSRSRLGKAWLNPLRTRVEGRFIASRVVIRDGSGVSPALAELTRRLGANEIVSITMGTEATRLARTPFLAGRISLATRPIALARETGAALLPVVTTRGADGVFTTEIGPTLALPNAAACDEDTEKTLIAVADFLKPHVLAYPAQFARAEIFGPAE